MPLDLVGEKPIRVLVAVNTRIQTELLAEALNRDAQLDVLPAPQSDPTLIQTVASQSIEVAVIGCCLEEEPLRGLEVLQNLRSAHPSLQSVMLLDSSRRELVLEAFRAGAKGVLGRQESITTLANCVRQVHRGQAWAGPQEMAYALEALASSPSLRSSRPNGLELLSKRELEVVQSLAEGLTNREIAGRLGLSQHTVKNYLFRVFDKLGVSSRIELLFLTMAQPPATQTATTAGSDALEEGGFEASNLASCKRAAERGFPLAQARLAEMYWRGENVGRDPIAAYMWYVISEETSLQLKDKITSAKRRLAESLTTDQILDAQQRATARLLKKPPSTRAETPKTQRSLQATVS
jgi:two-component system nitrate/nitrite response regulator NarL